MFQETNEAVSGPGAGNALPTNFLIRRLRGRAHGTARAAEAAGANAACAGGRAAARSVARSAGGRAAARTRNEEHAPGANVATVVVAGAVGIGSAVRTRRTW